MPSPHRQRTRPLKRQPPAEAVLPQLQQAKTEAQRAARVLQRLGRQESGVGQEERLHRLAMLRTRLGTIRQELTCIEARQEIDSVLQRIGGQ